MRLIDATKLEDLLRRQMEMDWNKQAAPASWSAAYVSWGFCIGKVDEMSKRILDPCCGSRMFWFDKNNPDVEFCDCRELHTTLCDGRTLDVAPDTIADFTNLPFEDNTFWHIVFDPPHMVTLGENSWMAKKYGRLTGDWEKTLHDGFAECMRVLKPNGTLIFKWNEQDIPVSKILSIIGYKPLYGHKSGKLQKTHWMAFIK